MPFTITQAARALGVAQHKLIHLCEKKVVVPDIRDARGRGTSRQFSRRNLFDFAVALEMRRLEIPVSFVKAVLRVLRSFEVEAKKILGGNFSLPDGLVAGTAPRLTLLILDGERLYFSLTLGDNRSHVFGGVDIRHPRARGRARQHEGLGRLQAEAKQALATARTRIEVDLSQIARDLEEQLSRA